MAEVTREQLAGAVETVRLGCMNENRGIDDLSSAALAERLLDVLGDREEAEAGPGGIADPELTAIAVIVGQLDSLSGTSGAGIASATRVLAYTASRYGYALADEED